MNTEQQRAAHTWQRSERYGKEHVRIAKSLPALIMNSGLMQVLAYCHEKKGEHDVVAADLRNWLCRRFRSLREKSDFKDFMEALLCANPADYQAYTTEAFAWLRWLRQMAPARVKED